MILLPLFWLGNSSDLGYLTKEIKGIQIGKEEVKLCR